MKTSRGASSACATSYPTGTPPRGRARTMTSSRLPSFRASSRPRSCPASTRSEKREVRIGNLVRKIYAKRRGTTIVHLAMAVKRSKQTQENGPRPAGQAFPIVAVGASAGGIEAFTTLLRNLPDSPEMAFIFILHQDPKHESNLAQILLRATKMPVEVIKPGVPMQPNHVYLAPPGAEVSVANGVLNLQ